MIEIDPLDLEYLTEEESAEVEAMLADEERRVTFADLKIRTKGKRLVTFVPNDVQSAYLDMLTQEYPPFDWRKGNYRLRGVREDVLKFRQPGISTLWLALYFLDTINNPLTETVIYAHDGIGTEKLFKIVHRFYHHLPAAKKRRIKYSSKKELVFEDIDSGLYVGVVGGATLGRGGTTNNVHLSERAWSPNFEELEIGLFPSVPDDGNITRETTANGFNEYYQERQKVKNGDSAFIPRFFAVYEHAEYKKPVPPDFVRTTEEEEIFQTYCPKGLDDGFLVWRRDMVSKIGAEKFRQEFPLSEGEAFLTSGNSYFNMVRLEQIEKYLESPDFNPLPDLVIPPSLYPMLRNAYDAKEFEVWELPRDGFDYIVTADPAGGLNTNGDADYCSGDVLCVQTWEQVAQVHGRWEPHGFAKILAEMGWLYGDGESGEPALLGVHRLNHGFGVLNALQFTEHYPVQRGNGGSGIYFYDPAQLTGQSKHPKTDTRQAGWPENQMTKPFMLDKLGEAILIDPGIKINCRMSVQEMKTYIHLPGGAAGGQKGSHDDRCSSLALGAALLNLRFERKATRGVIEPRAPVTGYGSRAR